MKDRPVHEDQDARVAACTQLIRDWVSAKEQVWLPLNGQSMAPFLPGGSKILVSKTAAGQIRRGDLLVFEVEGRLVCHRVLRRQATSDRYLFLTKGDGWRTIESWVAEAEMLGRVPRIERAGRMIDLNTPFRRLHAVTTATASLVVIGVRMLLRWGMQRLTARRTWARTW